MKGVLRFLVFATLGLALLWVITAGEGLFPSPEAPKATREEPGRHHRPIAEIKQGEGAVTIAPRGRIRIDSFRRLERPGGGLEQRPRYRIEAKDSEPDELGTYSLFDAQVTFFEDAPRPEPMARLKARKMTVALVTGPSGFHAREDQEMLITGAEISTGPAFGGGRFLLRTDQALVLMGREDILIHSPTPETPFRLEGEVGGGALEMKGRGLTARLPPLVNPEADANSPPASSASMSFQGMGDNEGVWRAGAVELQFSSKGPMEIDRASPIAPVRISMERDVRFRRQESGSLSFLRGDSLEARLRPGPGPPAHPSPALEWLNLSGRPALLGDPRGELRAQELQAAFDETGALTTLLAEGKPLFKAPASERGEVEARCSGALRIASLGPPLLAPIPLPGLLQLLLSRSLPAYRLTLSGATTLAMDDQAGPMRVEASQGIDLFLSREPELLSMLSYGRVETTSGAVRALSMDGITRLGSPWPALFPLSRTHLGTVGEPRPVRFTLLDRSAGEGADLQIEGEGLLELRSGPGGEELLEIQAAGPAGFIQVVTTVGEERVLLDGSRRLLLARQEGQEPRLEAEADWFLPFRLALPTRGMTAWAWRLEGDRAEFRLFGAEGQPVLLSSGLEPRAGASEPLQGRLKLLAPEVRFRANESQLAARGGIRLQLAGAGLMPGTADSDSRFWARELELRGSARPAAGSQGSTGPDTVHLLGQVFALIQDEEQVTWASGDELLAFIEQGRALLSGASLPACVAHIKKNEAVLAEIARIQAGPYARQPKAVAELLRAGDERSLAVISRLIQVSREEMTAGQLESGLGARLLLAAAPLQEGAASGMIEVDSTQPVSIKGPLLTFPGYTILRQGRLDADGTFVPDPEQTSLVCGSMTCRRSEGPGQRIDLVLGENGVDFRRGVIEASGRSLRFAPVSGELGLDGGGAPCTMVIGERAIRGPRLTLNIFDFTMTTPGFRLEGPTAVEARSGEAR